MLEISILALVPKMDLSLKKHFEMNFQIDTFDLGLAGAWSKVPSFNYNQG